MDNIVVFTLPLLLAMIAAISALHVVCAILSALFARIWSRILCIVLSVINGALHLMLIAYSIVKDVPIDELLCLLMLSAAVGMVSMGASEKHKRAEREDV